MYKLKRALAGVVAVCIVAATAVPLSAEAIELKNVPGSDFEYELKAELTENNQIEVTFYSTYNPGILDIPVAVQFDPEKCSFVKAAPTEDMIYGGAYGIGMPTYADGAEIVKYSWSAMWDSATDTTEYSGAIGWMFTFDISDTAIADKEKYTFSTSVYAYKSETEDINFIAPGGEPDMSNPDIDWDLQIGDLEYIKGDTDGDGYLAVSDASNALDLWNVCKSQGLDNHVSAINMNLKENGQISEDIPDTWQKRFGYLFRSGIAYSGEKDESDIGVACSEVVDMDSNGLIEQKDAEDILQLYADWGASLLEEMPTGMKAALVEITA